MHENKNMIFFSMFWRKLGILIPYLYLYGIKIQTNTKQNSVEKYAGKSHIFFKWFFLEICFLNGPDPAQKETGSGSAQ
jgi:hypothetical protein